MQERLTETGPTPPRAPNDPPRSSTRNRQALVRTKYERKEWAAKTPITSTPPTRGSTALAILAASEPDEPEPATAEVSLACAHTRRPSHSVR